MIRWVVGSIVLGQKREEYGPNLEFDAKPKFQCPERGDFMPMERAKKFSLEFPLTAVGRKYARRSYVGSLVVGIGTKT